YIYTRILPASQNLIVIHDVSFGIAKIRPERTETTSINANVGGVEVGVDVVITNISVDSLANEIR
ncbi:MAG: hypothetical protein ACK5N9_13410, partial [Pirellula sp.]